MFLCLSTSLPSPPPSSKGSLYSVSPRTVQISNILPHNPYIRMCYKYKCFHNQATASEILLCPKIIKTENTCRVLFSRTVLRQVLLSSPIYRWGNWSTEKLNDLSKVTLVRSCGPVFSSENNGPHNHPSSQWSLSLLPSPVWKLCTSMSFIPSWIETLL